MRVDIIDSGTSRRATTHCLPPSSAPCGDILQRLPEHTPASARSVFRLLQHRSLCVLEIGCGWGALAEKATQEFGAHLTGVTLSAEQLAWAQERLASQGLSDQVDLRLQDYRDIADGPFDAICLIEMLEAVGHEYCLPSPREFKREAHKAGLKVVDEFHFGRDYAETCRRWRTEFVARKEQVIALGFDERFIRIWDFYLAYCEAGFEAGDIDVVQYTLAH